ncbi:response regulator [uncultured Hyphomicrobium sp.]|uniref:response regulator n=1 Tax=uncultured Hyphomicrobium sp. TaxID=194373 RepID=UPI0025F00625|nr:response regulator [uncultured Hyphomicrobium sp.]
MTATTLRQSASSQPPTRILIVEDDPILRFTLAMELNQEGFAVREARDADEAETVLQTGAAIDAIVTDIEMPGARDGIALAKYVRAFYPGVRVIVVSGIVPKSGIVGVADAFFGKPYDIERIILRVRALLSAPPRLASAHAN